jgi:hypothetical protein
MHDAGNSQVVDERPAAANQLRVFDATNGISEQRARHALDPTRHAKDLATRHVSFAGTAVTRSAELEPAVVAASYARFRTINFRYGAMP